MRCTDFDGLIEEMLSGILHPDASLHMRQCERCHAYFRARSAVYTGLRALASAPVHGPSRATDRKVMESFRRLQQGRENARPSPLGRVLSFPGRRGGSDLPRTRWGGLAVAVALLAIVGSGIHLWTGTPTVTAPSIATAPAALQSAPALLNEAPEADLSEANLLAENVSRSASPRLQARLNRSARAARAGVPELVTVAKAEESSTADEAGVAQGAPVAASSIMRLASTGGAANGVAQSAGSTWPGYDNLMYCDPVVCSGPMQVVNIKVPASQLLPNTGTQATPGAGKADGNSLVNVEVLVGPDGVARAIRVAH